MRTRLAVCALALTLAGTPGCIVYRYVAVPDVRQFVSAPYHGALRVTQGNGAQMNLRPTVELVGDTVFGWYRPPASEGLVRTGLPLRAVVGIEVRRVNWPATIILSGYPFVVLAGGVVCLVSPRCLAFGR